MLHFCRMTNKDIARLLRQVAASYTLQNENRFKIIAYEKAADSIEHMVSEAKDLWNEGKLSKVSGIGPSIASHLDELFKTGKVRHFDDVMAKVPSSVFPLLNLPGFGAKKAYKLVKALHLNNAKTVMDELLKATKNGKVAKIEGFGEKSAAAIQEAVTAYKKGSIKESRMPLPYAYDIANDVMNYLRQSPAVLKIATLGSLRRMVATIGDVDLAVATNDRKKVIERFLSYPKRIKTVETGKEGATILLGNNRHIDLRVIALDAWGSMLQYFTGSKLHNIHLREYALKKGYSLNEYGIKAVKSGKMHKFADEGKFYNFLGFSWIPPELREDTGEIETDLAHKLPKLVNLEEINGDLQIHSSYPIEPSHDLGISSMEEIIKKAEQLDYKFIAFTEHNPSISKHTKGQIISILKNRKDKIEQLKSSSKSVRILNMLEVDILSDGNIALPNEAFAYIDAFLVSIHSSFTQSKEEMTRRIIKGLSHDKAKIWAHPTGRIINEREGISADFGTIFQFCAKHQKAIEINAYPNRLDLPDSLIREAKNYGIKFTIGTDSHDLGGLDLMFYGVAMARRGWLKSNDILNTMEYNELVNWLLNNHE